MDEVRKGGHHVPSHQKSPGRRFFQHLLLDVFAILLVFFGGYAYGVVIRHAAGGDSLSAALATASEDIGNLLGFFVGLEEGSTF